MPQKQTFWPGLDFNIGIFQNTILIPASGSVPQGYNESDDLRSVIDYVSRNKNITCIGLWSVAAAGFLPYLQSAS
jgi:hypothetical protein